MQPVIEHLLARKNKQVPVEDGRKIALVLFGGIMVGVRGMGALVALEELGLAHSFDYIYTMSSGFINASYFLSGQMTLGAAAYYQELSGKKFLNLLRFWNIADINYLMGVIKTKKPLNVDAVLSSKTKLSRVETTPSNLRKAAVRMGSLVKNAFGSNKKINLKPW